MDIGPLETPAFAVADPAFEPCVAAGSVTRLWTGGKWLEGPAWLAESRTLVWSDIPRNRMLQWSANSGEVGVFRHPSAGGNGNTVDREGRLITCEQYSRRMTRTGADGQVEVLVDRFEGRRFNAPNDVVVTSDGAIWFTDPDYGGGPDYEGARELEGCHVYRFVPESGQITQMTTDMVMPNGLAFSLDERELYVIDTGSTHAPDGPNHIRRFAVADDGQLGDSTVIATSANKTFDGLRLDEHGRLWCGEADGIHCLDRDGQLLGKVVLPERASNLTFGGEDNRQLFITATTSLYTVMTGVRGAL